LDLLFYLYTLIKIKLGGVGEKSTKLESSSLKKREKAVQRKKQKRRIFLFKNQSCNLPSEASAICVGRFVRVLDCCEVFIRREVLEAVEAVPLFSTGVERERERRWEEREKENCKFGKRELS
jgi:hypothetical protein